MFGRISPRLLVLLLVACSLVVAVTARAQDAVTRRPMLLLSAGYGVGMSFGSIPVFAGSGGCGLFESGTENVLGGGIGLLVPLASQTRIDLEVRVAIESSRARLVAQAREPFVLASDHSGQNRLVSANHEYRLEHDATEGVLSVMPHVGLGPWASVGLGLWGAYRPPSTVNQVDALVNEPEIRFPGGRIEQVMREGERLTPTSFGWGFIGNVRYQWHLSPRVSIAPEFSWRFDLGSRVEEFSWRGWSARFGATLMLDILQHDTLSSAASPVTAGPVVTRDTVVIAPAVEPAKPVHRRVALELYGVDEANNPLPQATIRVYEVLNRHRAALLDAIYFDRSSSRLPSRYAQLSPSPASAFAIDSLAGLGPLGLHYQALNIIGYRLKNTPRATLTLEGSASGGESALLAHDRAEAIRRYLYDAWGIDTTRIAIREPAPRTAPERGEDARAENRRVSIATSDPAILDPLVTSTLTSDFDPPLISLNPTMESDAGVRHWEIVVKHAGHVVGTVTSQDTGTATSMTMNWRLDGPQNDVSTSFLVAELTAEDSTGAVMTTRTQVPLVIERNLRIVDRMDQRGGSEVVRYSLLAFAHNSAEINRRNRAVLSDLTAGLRPGARITVIGYTDRTGTDPGNSQLSRKRAAAAEAVLRGLLKDAGIRNINISVAGEGYEAGRFDNTLPEGRVLSRQVDIVVEQPAPAAHR